MITNFPVHPLNDTADGPTVTSPLDMLMLATSECMQRVVIKQCTARGYFICVPTWVYERSYAKCWFICFLSKYKSGFVASWKFGDHAARSELVRKLWRNVNILSKMRSNTKIYRIHLCTLNQNLYWFDEIFQNCNQLDSSL